MGGEPMRAEIRQRDGARRIGEGPCQLGQLSKTGVGRRGQTDSPGTCSS
jgi:hypothetical protein